MPVSYCLDEFPDLGIADPDNLLDSVIPVPAVENATS
jgi:hypothetical protein